jgi:Carboxypeptidase regulatory-like domain/TonB-dependent Receptor Plug Domain
MRVICSLRLTRYFFIIGLITTLLLPCQTPEALARQARQVVLRVTAHDESDKPVPGVLVEVKGKNGVVATGSTNDKGEAEFPGIAPGTYEVVVSKEGTETLNESDVVISPTTPVEVRFTIIPKIEVKEAVTVQAGGTTPAEQGASTSTELQRTTLKNLPDKPATVADALPLVPGIVRSPEGQLRISGAGENRSALVVNSADVTDPATGQFGVTVPVDSVETVNVFKTPYLAQYGRFTAGVVSVETKRGGDKWNWELNDPLPEFRIKSGHLRGLKEASPRITFNGPIIAERLFFSEGIEYELRKRPVRQLPFPFNEEKQESLNSFTQLDYIFSPLHTLTGTFHVAPRNDSFVNLDFFNPQPVTPNFRAEDYTGTLIDRLTLGSNLLESTVAIKRYSGNVWAQGQEDMVLTPTGNLGSYFSEQDRHASRAEWLETYSLAPIQMYGAHNLKFGSSITRTSNRGKFVARPVDILDNEDRLIKRVEFVGGEPFDRTDLEVAFFGQDHWIINRQLALDVGSRFERQGITETIRIAPRIGLAWAPFANQETVIRTGFGFFYDRVPLSVYSFDRYPEQLVTTFGPGGGVIDGPRLFANITDRAEASGFPFVFNKDNAGNFSPYSATWNVEIEHPINKLLRVRANYLQSNSSGVITVTPKVVQGSDAIVLGSNGKMRYRQLELIAKLSWNEGQQLFFSYVRSQARGDLNEFNNYLGNFPFPIVRASQFTNLPGDLPNRFLAWGLVRLPWKMRVAPIVEYRNGFPYSVLDAAQNYVGVANSNDTRFPNFYSLDARVSKDIALSPKYGLRVSVTGYNLTNHFNPAVIHANVADPQFGTFFGNTRRRFRLDFDVLF